jgi:hypothetical protein
VFTARYALNPYIKQIHFVFKGLITYPGPFLTLSPPSAFRLSAPAAASNVLLWIVCHFQAQSVCEVVAVVPWRHGVVARWAVFPLRHRWSQRGRRVFAGRRATGLPSKLWRLVPWSRRRGRNHFWKTVLDCMSRNNKRVLRAQAPVR